MNQETMKEQISPSPALSGTASDQDNSTQVAVQPSLESAGSMAREQVRIQSSALRQGHDAPVIGPASAVVRVAFVSPSKHVFRTLPNPPVIVGRMDDPAVREPDVLVFPRSDRLEYRTDAALVPDRLWRRAQQRSMTVVFDASNEGAPHEPALSKELHGVLETYRVPSSCAAYVTQDRQYQQDYARWCAGAGAEPMRVCVFDGFISRALPSYRAKGEWFFDRRLENFMNRRSTRSRRFLCLNYHPRAEKVLFLLRLLRDGLWDNGWISFGGFFPGPSGTKHTRKRLWQELIALEGFEDDLRTTLPHLDQLADTPLCFSRRRATRHQVQRAFTR
jgi:hypothetical protein